ncbi:MAG: heavy-metal-associated domain-containing protein [Bacteroidales bacterium]|nr:heavy-metal-associated domain-containing protein [Bacteroidales bacterium]
MKKFIFLMALAIASVSASAQRTKSADTLQVTTTPQMHCANCEKKIKSNIRFVKGVKKIETSVSGQTVTIVYEPSKSGYEDFVKAFQKIGYKIEKVKDEK